MMKYITMLMALLYSLTSNAQATTQIAEESFGSVELMILLWIAIAVVLFVCIRIRAKSDFLTGTMYYVRWVTFLLLCALELIFIPVIVPDINHSEEFTVALFVLCIPFGITALLQLKNFFDILEDYKYNYSIEYYVNWGPISLIFGTVLTFVGVIFDANIIFGTALITTIISQIVYILILFIKVFKSQNVITALMCVITYLLGLSSIVFICAFVLFGWLMYKMSKFFLGAMLSPTHTKTYPYDY